MQIRFPFAFEAEVREKGQRKTAKAILGEWATAEVREVADEDAPPFVTFSRPNGYGLYVTADIREYGGDCYRPKNHVPHGQPYDLFSPQVSAAELGAEIPIAKTFFRQGWGDVTSRGTDAIDPDGMQDVAEAADRGAEGIHVVSSVRDRVLQRNLAAADDLIVIDGEVWEKCQAPHLLLSLSDRPPEVTVIFEAPGSGRVLQDDVIVPVSEMDALGEAVDRFHLIDEKRVLQDERDRTYTEEEWEPADVAYPELRAFAPGPAKAEIPFMIGRASHYLKASFGHLIGDLQDRSVSFVRSWADMKEAIQTAMADGAEADPDALIEAWSSFSEACRREPPRTDVHGRPAVGAERHKSRTDLRLECEMAGWAAYLGRRREAGYGQADAGTPSP